MKAGITPRLVFLLVMLAGCGHAPAPRPMASTPDFSNAVFLEDVAETTANASIGDLDGDGDPDIVLAKGRHWPLHDLVLLNDGTGGFDLRHPLEASADRSYTTALADLDGDGDLDLVVGNDKPDDKRIHFNDGHGRFRLAGTFGSAAWATRNVTVADVDADARPDIIVANRGGPENRSKNHVCLNDGAGRFPACNVLSSESATTIAAADFDGNGTIDLVVPHRDGGQSYIYPNDGSGRFSTRKPIGPADAATRAVAVGDLDGNGAADVIMGDAASGGVRIYLNGGTGNFAGSILAGDPADRVFAIATADLNADGKIDVVIGNENTPGAVLFNRGDGHDFERLRFGDGRGAVYGLAIGDVTGDGCPDIVAARSEARSVLYVHSCRGTGNPR